MGIIRTVSIFEGEPPRPNSLCKTIEEISGLSVQFTEDKEPINEYRAFSGKLAFPFNPEDTSLEIYSYIPGAVKAMEKETENRTGFSSLVNCEGFDDCDEAQRIYLRSYIGQEMTLHNLASLALHKLGGRIDDDIEYLEQFNTKLSVEEVKERIHQNNEYHRKRKPFYVIHFLFCICMTPFYFIWVLITMPYYILKAYREHPEIFKRTKCLPRRRT